MSRVVIRVENLSKCYTLRHEGQGSGTGLRHAIQDMMSAPFKRGTTEKKLETNSEETFWALRDLTFDVREGEVLGVIGRNGAGKSTLLKVLSRITEPSRGRVGVKGRIASLLEVGTGFHPELTGRENIYLNGAILGMTRAEIRSKFDEIVAFAEVEKFLDTPVKRYSSGMYVRLAFAVAAHLEPEILIVDEVLAVGDSQFQNKCIGKMKSVSRSGRTVLFVSHNMMAIQSLCTMGLVLKNGRLIASTDIASCIDIYLTEGSLSKASKWRREFAPPNAAIYFHSVDLFIRGEGPDKILELDIELKSQRPHSKAFLAADIVDQTGTCIMQALPVLEPFIPESRTGYELKLGIDLPPLVPGMYAVTLWIGSHNTCTFDEVFQVITFEIIESPTSGRTFPHTRDHGFMVPKSNIIRVNKIL